jgi:hypothetical protein
MPADALSILQEAVTRTATLNGSNLDLKTGTPRRGFQVRLRYSAASVSASTGTAKWVVQGSDDGNTFEPVSRELTLALTTTAKKGVEFLSVETSKRYLRLALSTISGTDATVTYAAEIVPGRP